MRKKTEDKPDIKEQVINTFSEKEQVINTFSEGEDNMSKKEKDNELKDKIPSANRVKIHFIDPITSDSRYIQTYYKRDLDKYGDIEEFIKNNLVRSFGYGSYLVEYVNEKGEVQKTITVGIAKPLDTTPEKIQSESIQGVLETYAKNMEKIMERIDKKEKEEESRKTDDVMKTMIEGINEMNKMLMQQMTMTKGETKGDSNNILMIMMMQQMMSSMQNQMQTTIRMLERDKHSNYDSEREYIRTMQQDLKTLQERIEKRDYFRDRDFYSYPSPAPLPSPSIVPEGEKSGEIIAGVGKLIESLKPAPQPQLTKEDITDILDKRESHKGITINDILNALPIIKETIRDIAGNKESKLEEKIEKLEEKLMNQPSRGISETVRDFKEIMNLAGEMSPKGDILEKVLQPEVIDAISDGITKIFKKKSEEVENEKEDKIEPLKLPPETDQYIEALNRSTDENEIITNLFNIINILGKNGAWRPFISALLTNIKKDGKDSISGYAGAMMDAFINLGKTNDIIKGKVIEAVNKHSQEIFDGITI